MHQNLSVTYENPSFEKSDSDLKSGRDYYDYFQKFWLRPCLYFLVEKMLKNTAKITIFFLGGYAPQTALNPLYVIWYANIE